MTNNPDHKKISKFLSLVLRHQPEKISIELDANGWTSVDILIEKLNEQGVSIDRNLLDLIVETNPKKRFAFNESMDKIRASQGHSVEVELEYQSQQPPGILFHGTAAKSVESILQIGLQKRGRHHVHLSTDVEAAIKVGQRHGKPVIFVIRSAQMFTDGFVFYLSENGVWLTEAVPPQYLEQKEVL